MRKFLVVLDDSRECLNAMRFAAMRAAHTGGGVEVLAVIPTGDAAVAGSDRAELCERIEAHFEVFAKWMRDKQNVDPELVIRDGDPVTQIIGQITDDGEVGVLVLGASNDPEGPGPLVTALVASAGELQVPMTIVPGDLTKDRLEAIT